MRGGVESGGVESEVKKQRAWPMVRLGDVCEEIRDRVSVTEIKIECYITTDNMIKGCGGVRVADSIPLEGSLVKYRIGDVLISNIRPYLKKTWLADRDGGCSSDVIVFRSCREDLSSEYLFRALTQDGFFEYSMLNVSGTKMPRGKRDWIKDFQIPLPPLSVQKEIVERLEKELGEADKVAANFKKMIELADAEFKAELDETFKVLENGAGEFLTQRSRGAEVQRVRLGDVCEIKRGRVMSKKYLDAHKGVYPVFSSQTKNDGVFGYIDTFDFDGEYLTWTTDGANAGSVFYHNGKFSITNVCGLLKVDSRVFDAKCLCYMLRSVAKTYVNKSMGNPKLMSNVVARIVLPRPSLDIQRSIVAKLDAAKERCEKLKAAAERGLKAAENLRKAILAEAFE